MNSQRLSLSSSVFADRIKKFDTYQHNPRTSQRVPKKRVKSTASIRADVLKKPQLHIQKRPVLKTKTVKKIEKTVLPASPAVLPVIANGVTEKLALSAIAKSQSSNSVSFSKQFNDFRPSTVQNKKKSKWQIAFYSFGMVVFLFAAIVSIQTMLTNNEAIEQINVLGEQTFTKDEQGVTEGTGSNPAEQEISASAIAQYSVSPELPRYLRIPEIDVYARIKHTGIDKDGSVDAPRNIHDVSWFKEGTVPGGDVGASLLLGHTSGWSGPGVFKNIGKLTPGNMFEVEKGSGEKILYEVTNVESRPVEDINMGSILGPAVAGEHDVKLMTCSGKYNRDTESYADRTIVYAKVVR